ncbi:hypothetical protein [Burkholderia sp. ABCPW 14]|uniref:hypothetical protein n=1 Tax=Burkholderia sp. ABCPW 14 TaxID=1637860 RepID=UPI0012E3F9F5|nr:hypothetical protein [Burkholderia sp. ABCPW 14]
MLQFAMNRNRRRRAFVRRKQRALCDDETHRVSDAPRPMLASLRGHSLEATRGMARGAARRARRLRLDRFYADVATFNAQINARHARRT